MQTQIEILGAQFFKEMQGEKPSVFNGDYWQGKLMDWVMKDPSFKVDLFHFVDVLPQLEGADQVAKHIREYLLKEGRILPGVISVALKAAASGFTAGLASKSIRKNISDLAERFIVGHDAKSALKELEKLHKQGIAFTVDLLGESTLSELEAESYQKRYLDLVQNLVDVCHTWPEDAIMNRNHRGPIPRVNVSIKVSALASYIKSEDPKGSVDRLRARLLPLFEIAQQKNVFLNLDLEQWDMHDITYDLFESLSSFEHIGIVVQAYLKNAQQDLERLLAFAGRRQKPIGVRLVKGAYWDYEVVNAQQKGFECPVLTDKAETDLNYERLSRFLLDHIEYFQPAFGSHNLRSIAQALVYAEEKKIPKNAYEVQMLYGMAEPERKVLRSHGHRVRVYAPIGDLLPGMAYLVRRLLENTSNSGFLKLSHQDHMDIQSLLVEPRVSVPFQKERQDFQNCAFTDFTRLDNRDRFQTALEVWKQRFPVAVPVVLSGETQSGEGSLERVTPNDGQTVVARVELATLGQAEKALNSVYRAYPAWRSVALSERAALLNRLADILERDRFELAALQCFEVAKPWRESDADVAEAVDFCRYYAQQALLELAPKKQGSVLGEENILSYEGRGPTLVIAPWNFPLAILCGMASAALVSGNPVILKPAENSSLTAKMLLDRIFEAGFPREVCQFLPGRGSEIGTYLVEHPLVAQIAFTGSRQVGLQIIEKAARTKVNQPQVKRVVCEMGGKNAIIIDDDADLDEAMAGVIHSAFGYAGQKCSAASRVLVHEAVYDNFVSRLVESAKSLKIGEAYLPDCHVPPVVDQKAQERLLQEVKMAKERFNCLLYRAMGTGGFFAPLAIFEVTDFKERLMQEEFFGPVLAIMKVKNFQEALCVATSTEFALTGAVYSRSPRNLEEARRHFRVGNLYLNRGSTGAMVHRQPFGGFGMSGMGTKAGGPGYLLNFVDPRCVTENTMRRGFTPDLE